MKKNKKYIIKIRNKNKIFQYSDKVFRTPVEFEAYEKDMPQININIRYLNIDDFEISEKIEEIENSKIINQYMGEEIKILKEEQVEEKIKLNNKHLNEYLNDDDDDDDDEDEKK
jgi:hypothetical protein